MHVHNVILTSCCVYSFLKYVLLTVLAGFTRSGAEGSYFGDKPRGESGRVDTTTKTIRHGKKVNDVEVTIVHYNLSLHSFSI